VLPDALGRTSKRTGAPVAGSLTQSVVALIIVIGFAAANRDPIRDLFTWLGVTASTGVVAIMAMVSISVIGFFGKRKGTETTWQRIIAPALATVFLITVLVLILMNFNRLLGAEQDTALRWILPGLLAVGAVAGLIRSSVLRNRKPAAYAKVGGVGETLGSV
jgi:amino acid transporter